MKHLPEISIIIPCRNEEKFIAQCLDSILAADFPKDDMEVLVVDGMSQDKTRDIVKKYSTQYPFIYLLDNPKYITPCALNIGIKNAKADIVIRIDAHAKYDKNYFKNCVKNLALHQADNVGGPIETLESNRSLFSKAIAKTYSSIFGVGSSFFRIGVKEVKEVDTVFGGCYKKSIFEKIGLFNENLKRSQDMELNLRLKRKGGKIYLCPDIISYYYAKSSLKDFFVHNFHDGVWAVYPIKFVKLPLSFRHYIPLTFVVGLAMLMVAVIIYQPFFFLLLAYLMLYFCLAFYFAAKIAIYEKDFSLVWLLPVTFFARHFGYGLGSIVGIIKLFT